MSTSPKTVAEIRNSFLDFFVEKGHTIVPSSPLVPFNDPTLMFTNSGMVQFKDVFLGVDRRPYVRAVSVQTCLRAGGKHNDLENVGYTARHHTFFEMLGNWSFGDYFKRESLLWGWELLTRVYGLPADKLWATVYIDDNEAYDIWTKEIGLPAERVIRIGDNKGKKYASDNFWMMADTGPCGPCSEIFYDHGPEVAGGPPGSPNEDGDRFIEIWNHVFMQFDMQPDGSLVKLPKPCVDTGMGLERLAAVLQHVHSNYEIDLFAHLISAAAKVTDCQDLQNKSLYVIADHIRAATFLVTDGVTPSNEGRGYVQRRIIRRAIRHGYKLGKRAPFFHHLVAAVVKEMGEAYPKLIEQQAHITTVLRVEEERFFETLATGMEILENNLTSGQQLAGEVAFKLHDTFGFPLDLSADVCREAGVAIDMDGFNACMQEQKNKARAAGKFKMDRALEYTGQATLFVGYDMLSTPAYITALYLNGKPVNELKMGEPGVVVLSSTPFYAESGGQIGDAGLIHAEAACFEVQDTQKIKADVFGHHGTLTNGMLRVGDAVTAAVNEANRRAIMRNHSATHLLHQALRDILGKQVEQKGSLVSAERTRFDFVHNRGVSNAEILLIEQQVNEAILRNAATKAKVMSIDDAKKTGAMMLFGEKYGEEVRVLEIDASQELCGGTHVARTGDIGLFKIISESGVAAGVRRIEGVTGLNSLHFVQKMDDLVANVAGKLRTSRDEVSERVSDALSQIKKLEKELQDAQLASARTAASALTFEPVGTAKNKLLLASLKVPPMDANALREAAGSALSDKQRAVVVLACVQDEKVQMVVRVTPDLTHQIKAGELVNFVAIQVGGKGGGKPDMAMAGGTNASQLNTALASVLAWVKQKIEP